jgi:hypothetical protein
MFRRPVWGRQIANFYFGFQPLRVIQCQYTNDSFRCEAGLGFSPYLTVNFECRLRGKVAGSSRHSGVIRLLKLLAQYPTAVLQGLNVGSTGRNHNLLDPVRIPTKRKKIISIM